MEKSCADVLRVAGVAAVLSLAGCASTPTGSPTTPAPSYVKPSYTDAEWTRCLDAYVPDYTEDELDALGRLWNYAPTDIGAVKCEIGRRRLAGQPMAVLDHTDTGTVASEAPSGAPSSAAAALEPTEQGAVEAFFEAGYTYDDAVELAQIWRLDSPWEAKVQGGERLLADRDLPFRP